VIGDERGFFFESFNARSLDELTGQRVNVVQHNHNHNHNHNRSAKNVLRGLHYQIKQPQSKLVRVSAGAVFDVAVDLRAASPFFGRWVGVLLSGAARLRARLRGYQRQRRMPVQNHRLPGSRA